MIIITNLRLNNRNYPYNYHNFVTYNHNYDYITILVIVPQYMTIFMHIIDIFMANITALRPTLP